MSAAGRRYGGLSFLDLISAPLVLVHSRRDGGFCFSPSGAHESSRKISAWRLARRPAETETSIKSRLRVHLISQWQRRGQQQGVAMPPKSPPLSSSSPSSLRLPAPLLAIFVSSLALSMSAAAAAPAPAPSSAPAAAVVLAPSYASKVEKERIKNEVTNKVFT